MKGKKFLPILVLVLVVALGAMGVGYAAWTQNLVVTGTLTTGKLDVQWTNASAVDTHVHVEGGDGATCSVLPTGMNKSQTLSIDITNAYPGYKCVVTADLANLGTVPAIAQWRNIYGLSSVPGYIQLFANPTEDFAPGNGGPDLGGSTPIGLSGRSPALHATIQVKDNDVPQGSGPDSATVWFVLESATP